MRFTVAWTAMFVLPLLVNTVTGAELELDEAWVNKPLTDSSGSVAAFAVFTNSGDTPVNIVGASSDYAKTVQLHRIVHEEGIVRMRSVPVLTIPPGGEIHLNTDGLHLMLLGLQKTPWKESHISIQLHLETGRKVSQRFELRGANQPAVKEHNHQ